VASRTFEEHREEFLRVYDSKIFPTMFQKGQSNIPACVIDFKNYLEQRGYRAF
jgi:hypothetical protein